jgi:methylmalonyl-CoA mutase N-terminal domain/subunit
MGGIFDEEKLKEIEESMRRWEDTTLKRTLERHGERRKKFEGYTWREIKRVYTPLDIKDLDYDRDLGFPGEYPYTRGVQPTMYRGRLWTMRAQTGLGGAEETAERIKALMKAGEIGLSLDFDLPTWLGLDPDDPRCEGEVGRTGLSVSSLQDFELLFQDIPLDKVTTSMTINFPAPILYAMYLIVAEKQGVPWEKLSGTLQFDLLKEYGGTNAYVFPPRPSLRWWTDLVGFCVKHTPRWNPVSLWMMPGQGRCHQPPGQFIGYAFAKDMAYIDAALESGLDIDDFAPRLSFIAPSGIDFFESIAKLRAARRLWARIMKEKYGAKNPDSWRFRIYYPGSADDLTVKEPLNNIVRATIQILASVLGGAQAIDAGAYDEAYAIPTEESARMKLRTQQIIAYESRVADVVDPLAGSYYVEALTNQFEEQARECIEEIEELGGFIACIETGYVQRKASQNAYRVQKEKESGERIMVGQNAFVIEEEELPLQLQEPDPEAEKRVIERVRKVRAERDNSRVEVLLGEIRDAARGKDKLMPLVMEAVKANATMGEIMQALKDVWGEYKLVPAF